MSAICANLAYPAAPSIFNGFAQSPRPHAPTMICGVAVTYDPNGNTLSYDGDGTGTATGPRTLIYDGENRPIAITTNGLTSVFAYGPDGERVMKRSGSATSWYLGSDAEITVDAASPQGLLTSYLHPDVKRAGAATSYLIKDHLASNRLTATHGQGTPQRLDHGPYGKLLISGTSATPINGKAYINERYDAETRLQYLHARYLDPDLGRFLSPDTWYYGEYYGDSARNSPDSPMILIPAT